MHDKGRDACLMLRGQLRQVFEQFYVLLCRWKRQGSMRYTIWTYSIASGAVVEQNGGVCGLWDSSSLCNVSAVEIGKRTKRGRAGGDAVPHYDTLTSKEIVWSPCTSSLKWRASESNRQRQLLYVRDNFKRTQGNQINIGYTLQPPDITATA